MDGAIESSQREPLSLVRIDSPVGLREACYSFEVFGVICNENEIMRDGAGRYDQIEVVKRRPNLLQVRFDESEYLDALSAYRQDIERSLQGFDLREVARHLPGFMGAVIELHQGNGAYHQRVVEVHPQVGLDGGMPLEAVNDGIRIEEVHSQALRQLP